MLGIQWHNVRLKKINIKDAVINAAYAWRQVPASTKIKSWKKVWPTHPLLPEKETATPQEKGNENEETTANAIENEFEDALSSIQQRQCPDSDITTEDLRR